MVARDRVLEGEPVVAPAPLQGFANVVLCGREEHDALTQNEGRTNREETVFSRYQERHHAFRYQVAPGGETPRSFARTSEVAEVDRMVFRFWRCHSFSGGLRVA